MFTSVARRVANGGVHASTKRGISVQSLLHGSPEAKKAGDIHLQQHSHLVGRGKYIHDFEKHRVKPERIDEYKKAAERYYRGIQEDPELKVKLSGNWETLVGDQDTFIHITEYENYGGYDRATQIVRTSEHYEAYKAMLPFLYSRINQLNQEFAILPTAPPHADGGIFELRTYQLKSGTLLEWENTWRRGIEARRKSVAPVGAWFSQVGRLHQVHHMWQYPSLQARKEIRNKAWQNDGWAETVSKTAQLTTSMDSFILTPLSFSPLK
ncbi:hypothetical protein M413DRAFT_439140 [Hebeloma cylindrosporum]|uniref:NIPSNAP domain-containing protein n=1 Tax=Hebeloma cylindrosporum TaxID=76867 RepID=A0A0C3CFF7_HEBCY|nr:hypothetical protein M413DRAFT_439140 [Hebeloma cylindrosporum h7]